MKNVVDISEIKANQFRFFNKFTNKEIEHNISKTLHFELQNICVDS